MTRKDYVTIASFIDEQLEAEYTEELEQFAISLAWRFKEDNPRFDVYRFIDDCGIELEVTPMV